MRSADLLIVGALLSLSACSSEDKAPPGVAVDPSVVDDDAGREPGEPDAGSEQVDSGVAQDASLDAGGRDARVPSADAGADSAATEDDIDAALARLDGSTGELGTLARVERLLVADGRSTSVYALDVPEARVLDTFALGASASVFSGPSGRFGYVLVPDANSVRVVDMGLLANPKAESTQLTQPVQLLVEAIPGSTPKGFSALGRNAIGVLFAGGAEVATYADDETAVRQRAGSFGAGQPHTGVLLSLGDRLLTTRSSGSGVQLTLLDAQLQPTSNAFGCDAPRNGAVAGGVAAVSCVQGLLRVTADASAKLIAYPPTTTDAAYVSEQLVAHPSEPTFAALFADRLCTVRDAFQCVAQPAGGVLALSFDPTGKRVLALTGVGVLHAYASDTLEKLGELTLLTPLTGGLTPAIAAGRSQVYVSDPLGHQVHVVDALKLKRASSISLPADATPGKLAVFRYP